MVRSLSDEYGQIHAQAVDDEAIARFFGGKERFESKHIENWYTSDWEEIRGRILSSSYSPLPGHPHYAQMITHLRAIFDNYATNGTLHFAYDTRIYLGRLA